MYLVMNLVMLKIMNLGYGLYSRYSDTNVVMSNGSILSVNTLNKGDML